jgi:hypothetical protein
MERWKKERRLILAQTNFGWANESYSAGCGCGSTGVTRQFERYAGYFRHGSMGD